MLFSSVMILFSGGHESEAHGVTHSPPSFWVGFLSIQHNCSVQEVSMIYFSGNLPVMLCQI